MFDNKSLSHKVYIYLKEKIISKEFLPGERFNYNKLSKDLNISKMPLRDAIKKLEQDGFVEVKQRSGTFVSNPDHKKITDIYDVRNALESLALNLSFEQISQSNIEEIINKIDRVSKLITEGNYIEYFELDREVHNLWIKNSGNAELIKIMDGLEDQINWFSVLTTKNLSRPYYSNKQHLKILFAIQNNHKDKAQNLLKNHIDEAKHLLLNDYVK